MCDDGFWASPVLTPQPCCLLSFHHQLTGIYFKVLKSNSHSRERPISSLFGLGPYTLKSVGPTLNRWSQQLIVGLLVIADTLASRLLIHTLLWEESSLPLDLELKSFMTPGIRTHFSACWVEGNSTCFCFEVWTMQCLGKTRVLALFTSLTLETGPRLSDRCIWNLCLV